MDNSIGGTVYEGILFLEDKWYIEYLRYSSCLYFSSNFDIIELAPLDADYIVENPKIDFLGKKVQFKIIDIGNKKYAQIM
jgi:hypothetical protein